MKKIVKTDRNVKDQVAEKMKNVSWVVGIDIGKDKLSCALMDGNKVLHCCRLVVAGSLRGYNELLARVKKETKGIGKIVFALEPTGH